MLDLITKILELAKSSFWTFALVAAATGLFIYLSKTELLPPLEGVWLLGAWALLFLSAALAIAALGPLVEKGFAAASDAWARQKSIESAQRRFREYLPYMTDTERRILGYLLKRKQKTFIADVDGGYASTLMARNFVGIIAVPRQQFDQDKVPMEVRQYVWSVMEERPELFDYEPEMSEDYPDVEPEPWRIPWQLR